MKKFIEVSIPLLLVLTAPLTHAQRKTKGSQPQQVTLANVKLAKIQNNSDSPVKVSLETTKNYSYSLQGNQSVSVDENFHATAIQKLAIGSQDHTDAFREKLNEIRKKRKGDVSATLYIEGPDSFELR